MNLIIHRGTHEIGGSCLEIISESGSTRLVLDIGMPLVNADSTPFNWNAHSQSPVQSLLSGGILPKVKGFYANEEKSVDAILLSHAHLDHYGFLRFCHPDIPVYMSKGSKILLNVSNIFLDANTCMDGINTFKAGDQFIIGELRITPYLVDHSAPDATAFLIEGDGTKIFYTGDFRGHGRKGALLDKLIASPPEDIDYLIMEGSMLGRNKGQFHTEESVESGILDFIQNNKLPCFVFTSSQNLDRLVSIFKATRRSGKTMVIDLYTAFILDKLNALSDKVPQFDWGGIKVLFTHYHAGKLAGQDVNLLYKYQRSKIEFEDIVKNPTDKVILVKDNQYFRIIADKILKVTNACAVYSMWNGYLERSDLRHFMESRNIELREIHTTGHAYSEDLTGLFKAVKPHHVIPIHTFFPERYGEIVDNVLQLEDGQVFHFS
jgi:ribonuclease J